MWHIIVIMCANVNLPIHRSLIYTLAMDDVVFVQRNWLNFSTHSLTHSFIHFLTELIQVLSHALNENIKIPIYVFNHIASQCMKLSWVCFRTMVIWHSLAHILLAPTFNNASCFSFTIFMFLLIAWWFFSFTFVTRLYHCWLRKGISFLYLSIAFFSTHKHTHIRSIFNSCDCAKAFTYVENGTTHRITATSTQQKQHSMHITH